MFMFFFALWAVELACSRLTRFEGEDPAMPVKIIIQPSPSDCFGVLVTPSEVLTGPIHMCTYRGKQITRITLVLGNSTRKGYFMRPLKLYTPMKPNSPMLIVIKTQFNFTLTNPPLPINVGDLTPGCVIKYYSRNTTQSEIVDPMPFMQCSREFDLVSRSMEICAEVSASGQTAGLGSPMFCSGTLTAIKLDLGKTGQGSSKTVDIYMRLNFAEMGLLILSPEVNIKLIVSSYEDEKSLGGGAWLDFNSSVKVKFSNAMLITCFLYL